MRERMERAAWIAEVETTGAQLRRLCNKKTGREILWSGDPQIWSGTAPVLFPVVGRLRNGAYRWQGREYRMPKHGFARDSVFTVQEATAETLVLVLQDSPQTREIYPFAFRLELAFRLQERGVRVEYTVDNPAKDALWFTLGSHPGFALPVAQEPYRVVFAQQETLELFRLRDGLLETAGQPYLCKQTEIALTPELFARDALIFKDIASRKISVVDRAGNVCVTLDTGGAPHLGIWAKEGAPYVCLEPWFGYDDPVDATGELTQKPGMIRLAPGGRFTTFYEITA